MKILNLFSLFPEFISAKARRRLTGTLIIIATGYGLIFFYGLTFFAFNSYARKHLFRTSHSQFTVKAKTPEEGISPQFLSREEADVITNLMDHHGVPYAQRITFSAEINREDFTSPASVTAINPSQETQLFNICNSLVEGVFLKDNETQLLISEKIAKEGGIGVGDEVLLNATDDFRASVVFVGVVKGVVASSPMASNKNSVYMMHAAADWFLALEGGTRQIHFEIPEKELEKSIKELLSEIMGVLPDTMMISRWETTYGILFEEGLRIIAVMVAVLFLFSLSATAGFAITCHTFYAKNSILERETVTKRLFFKESLLFGLESLIIGLILSFGAFIVIDTNAYSLFGVSNVWGSVFPDLADALRLERDRIVFLLSLFAAVPLVSGIGTTIFGVITKRKYNGYYT